MALHPQTLPPVPEATAAAVHAAFPKGNLYVDLRAEFGALYEDRLFADLYPPAGRPVEVAPWRLALVMIMQYFEMLLGALCVQATRPAFFLFVCAWKLGTEFLYVPAQAYGAWWEVLERGSSYAAPLLWIGVWQVLAAHGVPTQGLIPRHWRHALGRAARHAEGRLRS